MAFVSWLRDKCGMISILHITGTRNGGYGGLDVECFALVCICRSVWERWTEIR